MSHDDDADQLIALLGGLRALRPSPEREHRVRLKCHARLAPRRPGARAADIALAAVACAYALVAVAQAIRLAFSV